MIELSYTDFKQVVSDRSLKMQYITKSAYGYDLYAFDRQMEFFCILEDSADITDFETNFKADANKKLSDKDNSGREIIRTAMTEKGWTFLSYCARITTATQTNSVIQKDFEDSDRFTISVKHFKSGGVLVTDYVADQANIIETRVTMFPSYNYEILKGTIFNKTAATSSCRVGVAVGYFPMPNDGYAVVDGNKTYGEFIGGLDMQDFSGVVHIDGESSKYVSSPTNQIQIRVHHAAGLVHTFACSLEYYRQ